MSGLEKDGNLLVCKLFLFFLLLSITYKGNAQTVPEIGFSVGASQYMGDLNNSPLKYPSPAGGIEFLYNMNARMGLKTSLSYLSVKGEGMLDYNNSSHNFTNSFINYRLSYFVNFLDYDFSLKKDNFSPYFILGFGYSKVLSTPSNIRAQSHFSFPFGTGVKLLIKNKVTIGLEYQFHRAFNDFVDGEYIVNFADDPDINNVDRKSGILLNKDWYSSLCLVITFKFINFADDCPAYQPLKSNM